MGIEVVCADVPSSIETSKVIKVVSFLVVIIE